MSEEWVKFSTFQRKVQYIPIQWAIMCEIDDKTYTELNK